MEFSEWLNYILGGGLLACIVGILTLKATVKKANAEAEKAKAEAERAKAEAERAKAEAETVRIDNAERATRILIENIVEPLKQELSETREELRDVKREFGSTKREMARFRKAVESANSCRYNADCPVLHKLRDIPKGSAVSPANRTVGIHGQPRPRGACDKDADRANVTANDEDSTRQPP